MLSHDDEVDVHCATRADFGLLPRFAEKFDSPCWIRASLPLRILVPVIRRPVPFGLAASSTHASSFQPQGDCLDWQAL
eukprot:4333067-Pleurochrysis_carterae.AAC.1